MNTLAQGSSTTQPKSVLERLAQTNPGLEVWWDSSPLVFKLGKRDGKCPRGEKDY